MGTNRSNDFPRPLLERMLYIMLIKRLFYDSTFHSRSFHVFDDISITYSDDCSMRIYVMISMCKPVAVLTIITTKGSVGTADVQNGRNLPPVQI